MKLLFSNAFRQWIRSSLIIIGMLVAISAFGLLRTVVEAWYAGVEAASSTRLVTRSAISLAFSLPVHYAAKIKQMDGVKSVSWASWFGGIYQEPKNFFPQFAIQADSYLKQYPEFVIPDDQFKAFLLDRKGCAVGKKLADQFAWKLGDVVPLRGTIYPGQWSFIVRAIYQGRDETVDQSKFFFHWAYLNEQIKKTMPRRADVTGIFVTTVQEPSQAAEVSERIDQRFKNSTAETRTETEKAFQLSFVSMTEAILMVIQLVSWVVIVIILVVMANTMAMTVRERTSEYATLRALGFSPLYVASLVMGESMVLSCSGGLLGIALTYPLAATIKSHTGTLFPIFYVSSETFGLQLIISILLGVLAGCIPAWRMRRLSIVEGLRHVG
jgi:putative ABC transport system permease protein